MYLGIDYGTRNVGLAVADGPLASPLLTISNSKIKTRIPEIISTYNVSHIIIGLPTGPVANQVEDFVRFLSRFNCQVDTIDETLSSHDARTSLLHSSRKSRQEKEHAVSAALILQSWLDKSL